MIFNDEFYRAEMERLEKEKEASQERQKLNLEQTVINMYQNDRIPFVDIADALGIKYVEVEEIIKKYGVEIKLKEPETFWWKHEARKVHA